MHCIRPFPILIIMIMASVKPIHVVIVAGGKGTRMGMALPKQFLQLDDKPILFHTIAAFQRLLPDSIIHLVLPADDISKLQMVLQHFENRIELNVVVGGNTRYESVQNGLKNVPEDALVMVHDGVRPFINHELLERLIQTATMYGTAIPVLPVIESIRIRLDNQNSKAIDRNSLMIVQTPQVFKSEILLASMKGVYQEIFTDEATVVEQFGHKIHLVEGWRKNIKITTVEDWELAQYWKQQDISI
jgi:2-C-methyl-D-erythritol 4-phosphate cytidylyltransferase